ncbi:unnamed protein product [Microthlaspi erraticum]|uniref:F-box domain-containing protein n=1 Tax=Microthlaspi erraticum TaxID=1685480 RepID=A0A6D2HHT2_9BRAS|nr:unnamed protein product [Microthlaspi erraticum]
MMISNLPSEMVVEIISRVPMKSVGEVRSTCKKWNSFFQDLSHEKYFLMFGESSKLELNRVNLQKINDNHFDLSINRQGYDKSCGSHKILKFFDHELEIYDLSSNSNSWSVPDATLGLDIEVCWKKPGVSVKGDTYWYARDKISREGFLIGFDFTRESFGPRLPLPFNYSFESDVPISAVGEDQLAVLMMLHESHVMEIWVTNKIEPDEVSWSKFLKVDMKPLACVTKVESFFIDEEKKVVVVFGEDGLHDCNNSAHIIGANGYFRSVDLGEYEEFACSYVPNSVHI